MDDKERRQKKKARRVALDAMLTMFTADEIATTALHVGAEAYREVGKVDSAPERAALLVEIAQRGDLMDELLAGILQEKSGESNLNTQ